MNYIGRILSPGARALSSSVVRHYGKQVRFGADGRKAMLAGIDTLTDAVASTMGPKVGALV